MRVVLAPLSVCMYMDTSMCLAEVTRRVHFCLAEPLYTHIRIRTWHGYHASAMNVWAYLTTQEFTVYSYITYVHGLQSMIPVEAPPWAFSPHRAPLTVEVIALNSRRAPRSIPVLISPVVQAHEKLKGVNPTLGTSQIMPSLR